ncbi:MAG: hypothetical protein GC171_02940 [Terrimonas sp.]|nr:hypothetical protein [Terrimonas sp.]
MNVMNFQDYDVIFNVFQALEKRHMEAASECLDGNFKSEILKQPVGATQFLELFRRVKEGMPDARFTIEDLTSDGETFKAKIKISGTHTHIIPSLRKGWKALKPTGKRINKVEAAVELVLRGSRIVEIRNCESGKGAIAVLLQELELLPKSYSLN